MTYYIAQTAADAREWPLLALGALAWPLEQSQHSLKPQHPHLLQSCTALSNWQQTCSLESLATSLRMPTRQMRQLFADHLGCTPREWRMRQACQLLAAGTSVSATAEQLGYTDVAECSKQFLRSMGCPPSRWQF